MGYYFYYLLENKIFVARNAVFFENSLMVQEAGGSHGLLESNRYGFYVDVKEYELENLNEPPNYKAALSDPKFDKWLEAMNTEMQSMKDNQVWVLVDLPPNGRTIRSIWLFKNKTDMDGIYGSCVWEKPEAELKVSCYADASFQTDKDDTKSQMRYVFILNASMEAVWMRKFIDGLGNVVPSNKRPMEMLCDNDPAIAIANELF
ncbi:hypothetical protein Tco_1219709 [Tanacetum coccineum]